MNEKYHELLFGIVFLLHLCNALAYSSYTSTVCVYEQPDSGVSLHVCPHSKGFAMRAQWRYFPEHQNWLLITWSHHRVVLSFGATQGHFIRHVQKGPCVALKCSTTLWCDHPIKKSVWGHLAPYDPHWTSPTNILNLLCTYYSSVNMCTYILWNLLFHSLTLFCISTLMVGSVVHPCGHSQWYLVWDECCLCARGTDTCVQLCVQEREDRDSFYFYF